MDATSQEEFDRIVALGSDSLNSDEKKFLYARRTYLTKEQREDFKDVIKSEDQRVQDEADALEAERNPKSKSQAKREAVQTEDKVQDEA
jgi:uncharacterized protein with WD repeat